MRVAATRSCAAVCVLGASQRIFPSRVDSVATLAEWSAFVAQRVVATRHGCFALRVQSLPKRVPFRSASLAGTVLVACVRSAAIKGHRTILGSIDAVGIVTHLGFVGRVVSWHLLLPQCLALLVEIIWRRGVKLAVMRLRFAVVCV